MMVGNPMYKLHSTSDPRRLYRSLIALENVQLVAVYIESEIRTDVRRRRIMLSE